MRLKFLFLGAKVGDRVPAVSVIVNCLNGARYLREALESVYAQTFQDWEIIFWDNASTDNSAAIAKSYDGRVKYFRSESTVSLGKARNLAMEKASGDYIAFLDCDDVWLPENLEKKVALFENDTEIAVVYSNTIFFKGRGSGYSLYKTEMPRGNIFRRLLQEYFLSLEAVLLRRAALDPLEGWFDERLEVTEEKDLFLRVLYRGKAEYLHEELSKWRVHSQSWTQTHYELYAKENRIILEKLLSLYPEVVDDYAEEIEVFKKKIVWQEGLALWLKGQDKLCRQTLFPYFLRDQKFTAAYLLSFLGPRAARAARNWYLRCKKI